MLPPPIAATVRAIILDTGLAGVSSAIVSLVNTDIGRFLMVLAGMLEDALKERRKRQIAEATAEATAPLKEALKEAEAAAAEAAEAAERAAAESNRLWRDWLERREQAERDNEPFDEPPPDQIDG